MKYVVCGENSVISQIFKVIKVREMILLLSILLHQSKGNDFASVNPRYQGMESIPIIEEWNMWYVVKIV